METEVPELAYLHSSGNGARMSIRQAVRQKQSGMKKGVPDIFLPVPMDGKHGLFIELKAVEKPSSVRPDQERWIAWLIEHDFVAHVCYGAAAAIRVIGGYLDLDRKEQIELWIKRNQLGERKS
jgi:hypothetical protein